MGALARVRRKLRDLRSYANIRGVVFFAQRRVRQSAPRRRIAGLVARFLPPAKPVDPQLAPDVRHLQDQGFVNLDGLVTPAMAEEMRRHFEKSKVFAPYLEHSPVVSLQEAAKLDSHVLQIADQDLITCPHLLDIANDSKVLSIVEGAFGCKPTIGLMMAWWSVPTTDRKARHAQLFHRDYDDVDFLKLFIYLNDVDSENGPHEFVRSSQLSPKLRGAGRYSDEEVAAAFPPDQIVSFTGPASSAFIVNTTGLHRGLNVQKGTRLILQVVFSMLPMAYGPARPFQRREFSSTNAAIDPYINRVYVDHA
ncbi:MAG: phytanoyl-CoA dioxygenase family protein [Reyranella sp.]|uniref:phytanoyl-CoA dioxygenase family protein n=1 Tax=Reyranella sp. TaxID=1929291 RepID=UPI001AD260DF|nr:phytanoyl-CoA dioxygenase family protein [Reyranella sp.]MBN9088892.1 phytanoyl-CoA dioxygenase family protein [Reyranella sp.]